MTSAPVRRVTCDNPPVTTTASRRPASSLDVAVLAGVSRSTVSHILNGHGVERFPQETRDRVLAAASALEYRPSPAGRTLVKGRSDTIVVLAPNTTWGGNLQDAVDRIIADTASLGANVVVRFAGPDREATVNAVLDLRPFAVLDLGYLDQPERERLLGKGVLTVPDSSSPQSDAPGVDDLIASHQVGALLRAGDRRIVFASIADERLDPYGPRRFDAVSADCAARGLRAPTMIRVPLHLESALDVLRPLFAEGPTGFACYNDDVALAVLAAARDDARAVPADVSVVGVDATELGQLWSPRLTTIDVDIRIFVDAAIDQLQGLLAGTGAGQLRSSPVGVRLVDGLTT